MERLASTRSQCIIQHFLMEPVLAYHHYSQTQDVKEMPSLPAHKNPPLEACALEAAREPDRQSGPQTEKAPLSGPRFFERGFPAARKV